MMRFDLNDVPTLMPACPPLPPPDIDVEKWRQSLALLRRLEPSRLLLTHFGSFDDPARHIDELEDRLIRIHCSLDRSFVPRFFVESVVFHEMLHAVIPPLEINGRTYHHGAAFRAREQRYPGYEKMVAFAREFLSGRHRRRRTLTTRSRGSGAGGGVCGRTAGLGRPRVATVGRRKMARRPK